MPQISKELISDAMYVASQYQNAVQADLEKLSPDLWHPRKDWLEKELEYIKALLNLLRELYGDSPFTGPRPPMVLPED